MTAGGRPVRPAAPRHGATEVGRTRTTPPPPARPQGARTPATGRGGRCWRRPSCLPRRVRAARGSTAVGIRGGAGQCHRPAGGVPDEMEPVPTPRPGGVKDSFNLDVQRILCRRLLSGVHLQVLGHRVDIGQPPLTLLHDHRLERARPVPRHLNAHLTGGVGQHRLTARAVADVARPAIGDLCLG